MKTISISICLLLCELSSLFSQETEQKFGTGFYVLKDYQYFKPLLADIRNPQFFMRVYRDQAVKFSNPATLGKHYFWDVGYGSFFPLVGVNFKNAPSANQMEISGATVFVEASAHMLLDLSAPSADVINTDFRMGGGLAARLPAKWRDISVRYKFFHESTHIGDEYILAAMADSAFHRYNVSYEAHEVYTAIERYRPEANNRCDLSYRRVYAIGRLLTKDGAFEDFKDQSKANALKTRNRTELQLGGEIFLRGGSMAPSGEPKIKELLKKIITPQYVVIAADLYYRDKYDVIAPRKLWSANIVVGFVYGNYFEGGRTTKLLINYYRGVNPHGQFRMDEISYIGVGYGIGF